MKKLFSILLVLAMVASLVLTGCGKTETDTNETSQPAQQQASQAAENESSEPVVLKVWMKNQTRVADYNNNKMTTWLEEQGNFQLEITSIPSEDFATKVNLALTVGAVEDLPDVIMGDGMDNAILEWSETGNIMPLTQYYNDPELAQNINEAKERTGVDFVQQLVMPDGEIYPASRRAHGSILFRRG